jgi:hypothetical protein
MSLAKDPAVLERDNEFYHVRKGELFGDLRSSPFANYLAYLLIASGFHFPRQILFSLLAQELGRALTECRIVR